MVNKPFKNAVRNAYRDHLDRLFQAHRAAGKPPTEFIPKLTMGALNPFLTGFVAEGILALKTPEMRECIQNCFARDGGWAEMRSPERQLIAQMEAVHILIEPVPVVLEGNENDEYAEELGAQSGDDSDSDDE